MKKLFLFLFVFSLSTFIFAQSRIKFSDVVDVEKWTDGFSAALKITSNSPDIPEGLSKIYQKDDNFRIDNEEQIVITKKEENQIITYFYDKTVKTYFTISFSGDDYDEDKNSSNLSFEEDSILEKVETTTFAGVSAVKYKIIEEKDDEDYFYDDEEEYIYIDKDKNKILGFESIIDGNTVTTELFEIDFNLDEKVFEPLKGYTKVEYNFNF